MNFKLSSNFQLLNYTFLFTNRLFNPRTVHFLIRTTYYQKIGIYAQDLWIHLAVRNRNCLPKSRFLKIQERLNNYLLFIAYYLKSQLIDCFLNLKCFFFIYIWTDCDDELHLPINTKLSYSLQHLENQLINYLFLSLSVFTIFCFSVYQLHWIGVRYWNDGIDWVEGKGNCVT